LDRKKNWRGRGTVRKRERRSEREGDLLKKNEDGEEQFRVRENFKKWKMREGEEEWERGRAWGRKRENMKTQNKKKVDEGEG
jgi:hypothetical protein